jgi:xylulokinase
MSTGCVLAIDLGTGGPKVAVVDETARVVAWRSQPVATTFVDAAPGSTGAEQDPHELWRAVCTASRQALATADKQLGALPLIIGVAVTSQYMSLLPIDGQGRPTGPLILWMDTRGAEHNMSLLTDESFILFAERHGLIPLPSGNDNVAHAHVLRTMHPDAYQRAAALVEPMDYLTARMTSRATATQSSVFGLLSCDNRSWGLTAYDDDLLAANRLDRHLLAELVPMNSVVGHVTDGASAELGIAAGTPVIAGTIDSITSAVGTGATQCNRGGIIIGTTSVLVTHITAQRNDLTSGLLSVPSPVPNSWYVMAENGLGGRALEWVLRFTGYVLPDGSADVQGALDEAARIAGGAEGVRYAPWLMGSIAPTPNDDQRGAFEGLSLHHDRRHAARAALEGIAASLAWLLPAAEAFADPTDMAFADPTDTAFADPTDTAFADPANTTGDPHRFDSICFGGGGAQSELWGQILADATGREIRRLAEPRATNARGAAILALAALGVRSLDDELMQPPVAQVHHPTADGMATMDSVVQWLVERQSRPVTT